MVLFYIKKINLSHFLLNIIKTDILLLSQSQLDTTMYSISLTASIYVNILNCWEHWATIQYYLDMKLSSQTRKLDRKSTLKLGSRTFSERGTHNLWLYVTRCEKGVLEECLGPGLSNTKLRPQVKQARLPTKMAVAMGLHCYYNGFSVTIRRFTITGTVL